MKKVLITGASRGLGYELSKIFSENGYHLFLHGNKNKLPDIVGSNCYYCDFSKKEYLNDFAEWGKRNKVDIFINNAAVYLKEPFDKTSVNDLEHILNVNFMVPAILIKMLWPVNLLVNINSLGGKSASNGEAGYCASKFGLRGFSQSLDRDASAVGGRIIDVYLGAMQTDMTKHRENYEKLIDPEEAAQTIFEVCKARKTLQIRELTITRLNY